MMWLEVIHVRVAEPELGRLLPIFTQLLDEIPGKEICRKVKLFKRALIETDICLHFYHDSAKIQDTGSTVGLHLASAVKPFGMVNHTVWMASDQTETR